MLKTQAKVREMLQALDLPCEDTPGLEALDFPRLRNIVAEEAAEFVVAMTELEGAIAGSQRDVDVPINVYWAAVIDAICDILVVAHNTSNAMGIDIEPFFDEVHRTNMEKIGGPIRADGKRLKPEGWKPPRIQSMLANLVMTGEAKP